MVILSLTIITVVCWLMKIKNHFKRKISMTLDNYESMEFGDDKF